MAAPTIDENATGREKERTMTRTASWAGARGLIVAACLALAACSSPPGSGTPEPRPDRILDPGTPVSPEPSAETQAAWQSLQQRLDEVESLTADEFAERHAVPFEPLAFDPLAAGNLAVIQASHFALDAAETALLARNGFAISERHAFPSFVYGYETLYAEDLPV